MKSQNLEILSAIFAFFKRSLSNCRYYAPKICQGQPQIWLALFQISSKSVHFRRSYSRTRKDRFCPVEYFQYRLFEPIITVILPSVAKFRVIYFTAVLTIYKTAQFSMYVD